MANAPGDLTVALLLKANADQAKAELATVQAQLKGLEGAGANVGVGAAAGMSQLSQAAQDAGAAATATAESLTNATAAASATADAMAATSAAVNAWGETAEQQAARIHDMVQASSAARDEAKARQVAEAAAVAASSRTTDAAAAQSVAWKELADRQTASMQAYTTARAPVLELQSILQKSTLTTGELARAEQLLDETQATGIISAGELSEAFAALDKAKIKDIAETEAQTVATKANAKANEEAGLAAGLNSRSRREVGTIVSEGLSGNIGRVRTSGLALANDMGLFTKLLTPVGLAISGVVVALGALTVAFAKGEAEATAYNKALTLTGGYAGKTVGELQVLAQETAKITNTTQHAAATTVAAVVESGKFYGDTVGLVAKAAVAMKDSTGQAVDRTIAEFAKLRDDPVKASVELNNATHYLTQSVYDQITALVQRGEKDQAAEVAQRAYAEAQITRAQNVADNLGTLQTVLHDVANAAKSMWDSLLDIGRTVTPESKISGLKTQLEQEEALLNGKRVMTDIGPAVMAKFGMGDAEAPMLVKDIQHRIDLLRGLLNKALTDNMFSSTATRDEASKRKLTDDALNAQQSLAAGAGTSDQQKLQTRLNDLAADKAKALYGVVDPDQRQKIIDEFNRQVLDAARQYDAAEKKLKPKVKKGPDLDKLQGNADVAAVRDQLAAISKAYQTTDQQLASLRKQDLISDTTYYAALRSNLDNYVTERTAALEKEKAAILSHATTAAQRIQAKQKAEAIDEQISELQQERATKRMQIDADEKTSIEKTKQAWLDLQASLGVPVDVNTSKAMKKLQELYALLQKLKADGITPDASQVNGMVDAALMTGVQKSPKLRSTRLIPGNDQRDNPMALVSQDRQAEQAAFAAQQQQLAKNYAAAQAAAKGNDAKLLQIQTAYQKDSETLAANHQAQMAQIDKAQFWGRLQVASDVFGQLAQLSQSHNRKVAEIGKAAAIAQAVIETFKNANTAYGEGLAAGGPYAGPELGAVYAAIAVAAGMANVASIRAQPTGGGYAEGGYTGAGSKFQVAGVVHAGEVVYSQADVARHGGVAAVESHRLRGYADGGFVNPLSNAPSPAQLGFAAPSTPSLDLRSLRAANDASAAARTPHVKVVMVADSDQLAKEILSTPTGTKLVVQHVGNNGRKIRGKWSAG